MSQQRQTERFLKGGLNVLPPGDLLPPEDAMETLNWRPDQQGQLRSRHRETLIDASTYATPVHTQFYQNIATPWRYTGGAGNLYRNGTLIQAGFDGAHLGLINWVGYLWVMNRAQQGRIAGTDNVFRPWLPAAPAAAATVATGGAGNLSATYRYYVTFDTAEGFESDLSPVSADITPASQVVTLTGIPVSADASVTARHIYRGGGFQDNIYQVWTIANNIDTTITDNLSDDAAARTGITHTADHGAPPACKGMASTVYHDKLIAFSSAAHPNWFWWTKSDKPWYWPGSATAAGNHAPVGEDGEEIYAASVKPRMVIFYKQRSIWRVVGDPDDASGLLEQVHKDIGILGPTAWCSAGPVDYFVGPEGVYAFDGESARKVSHKLDPIFQGDFLELGAAGVGPMSIDPTVRQLVALEIFNGRLYLSYAEAGHATNNRTLVMNTETGEWFRDDRAFSTLCNEGAGSLVGAIGNQVYAVESGGTQALTLAYQSRYSDQGNPENLKMYSDLVLDYDTGGAAIQVNALYDRGTAGEQVGVIQSTGFASSVFPMGVANGNTGHEGRNFALRLDGTAGASDCFLFSAHVHYYVTARLARTYDSQVVDLGPKTRELAKIAIEIDNTGGAPVTWHFYCDAGGTCVEVNSGTVPVLSGRQRPEYSFDKTYEARLVRVVLTSASPFRVYAVSLGESQLLDLGAVTHDLAKLALDLDTQGAALPWTFYADAGAGMAAVSNGTAAASGRQRLEFPLSAQYAGKRVRVAFGAGVPYHLYGAEAWARRIGLFVRQGTTFTLPPMEFDTRRVKLFKQVALELDGSLQVTAQTDLPGGTLATRAQQTVAHAGAGWAALTMPAQGRGRVLGLSFYANTDTRIYGGRVRWKRVGEFDRTLWDWQPLAIEPTPESFAWTPLPVEWIPLPVNQQ